MKAVAAVAVEEIQRWASSSHSCKAVAAKDARSRSSDPMVAERSASRVAAEGAPNRAAAVLVAAEGAPNRAAAVLAPSMAAVVVAASRAAVVGSPSMAVVTVEGVVEDWGCSGTVAVGSQRGGSSWQVATVPDSWDLCRGHQRL